MLRSYKRPFVSSAGHTGSAQKQLRGGQGLSGPSTLSQRDPHLVDFAEGAIAQLAHNLPHVVGVQVPADVLIFTGLSLLEGGKAQDAAEIGESHAGSGARPENLRLQ